MTPWQTVVQAWMVDSSKRTVTLIAAAALALVPGGPASAALLNLPDDVQVRPVWCVTGRGPNPLQVVLLLKQAVFFAGQD